MEAAEPVREVSTRNRFGCALKGCGVVVVLGIALGVFFLGRIQGTIRWGASEALVAFAGRSCERLRVPAETRAKILDTLSGYAQQVKTGNQSVIPVFRIMRAFDSGPVHMALLITALDHNFPVNPFPVSADQGGLDRKTLFLKLFAGVKNGAFPPPTIASLSLNFLERREIVYSTDAPMEVKEETLVLRTSISPERWETLRQLISSMTATVTVEPPDLAIDPIKELELVLAREVGPTGN